MFRFEKENISSNIARFRMFVESTDDYNLSGILYNETYGFAIEFLGVRQLLSRLDDFFNYVEFPQATHEVRSFDSSGDKKEKKLPQGIREISPGEWAADQALFILHVQFRQNSTWQGTLEKVAENETKCFRSELELIGLLGDSLKSFTL